MIKKILDESKILLIFVCDSKAEADAQINLFAKKGLITPNGYECSIQVVIGKKNLAATFNDIQKKNNAKYKLYITAPVIDFDRKLLMNMIDSFYIEPKTAMVGLMGSELPITGDYAQARNFYGFYNYIDENGAVQNYLGKDPFYYKSVHVIEQSFFATDEDISWDEKVGEDFIVAAQCCNMRSRGYDVGVYYQEKPFIIFSKDSFSYNIANAEEHNKQLEKFFNLYKKKIQPLVSVLIPTYNQPKFCCEALESALNQTYKNIEILIGDDSTNEDTKKAIRPYTKKYPNVRYFYHNGSIPRGGIFNMVFLLNHCSGIFVNYLLHDDLFYPEKISKMMNYYVSDLEGRINLVTSARDKVDETGKFLYRQNQWQPHSDAIIRGEEVGRRALFILANCVGELTTAMFRKKDVATEINELHFEPPFNIGRFCGVCSKSYGDLDTWLNILKNDGDFVFISESLSAFRKHSEQNTYNPLTRVRLPLDALMFLVIAWLNDVFFHNADEFYSCLYKWPILADRWFTPVEENDSEELLQAKNWIIKIKEVFLRGNREKMLDIAISFIFDSNYRMDVLSGRIRKNEYTGLWEKGVPDSFYNNTMDLCANTWLFSDKSLIPKNGDKSAKGFRFTGFNIIYTQNQFYFGSDDWTIDCKFCAGKISPKSSNPVFSDNTVLLGNTVFQLFQSYKGGDRISLSVLPTGLSVQIPSETEASQDLMDTCSAFKNYDYKYSISVNTTYHVEISRSGNKLFVFIDGKKIADENVSGDFGIKAYSSVGNNRLRHLPFIGYVDDFRISIGICRHTEDFTPPTEPYEIDEYTKCLLHCDKNKI